MSSNVETQEEGPRGLKATSGLELLTFDTPSGHKASILLEELKEAYGLQYAVQSINLWAGEQKAPWFTALSPNAKIPVLINHDKGGHVVFDSLAIINHLIRCYDLDKKFWFEDEVDISQAEQWLAWLQGDLSPTQGQAHFYYRFSPTRYPIPTLRNVNGTLRHYGMLDAHLKTRKYVAGRGEGKYSVADMALWSMVNAAAIAGIKLEQFTGLYEWWKRIGERAAVQSGTGVPGESAWRYANVQREREVSGESESDRALREALEQARKEFESV